MKTQYAHNPVRMAATKTAELCFEEAFKAHMHGHIGNFKAEYRTLYNKVIIPVMETMILANKLREAELVAEKAELSQGFSELAEMLMKVKSHLINIDPYFSSPKMVEQIDQVLEKYIS